MDLVDDILGHTGLRRLFAESLSLVAFLLCHLFRDFEFDQFMASQNPGFYLFQCGIVVFFRLVFIFYLHSWVSLGLFLSTTVLMLALYLPLTILVDGTMPQSFQPTINHAERTRR